MDVVAVDSVTTEISHTLHLVDLTINLNLITLHDLLDSLSNITEPDIDTSGLHTCLSGVLSGLQKVLELRVKGNSEGTIDQPAVDMSSKVDLADVVVS